MYYEEYGDNNNPTLVFLHCAGITETYLKLYSLSNQFHLIIPHLYGSGNEVKRDFNFEENKNAIIEIVDRLKKEKVYIIGHSEGANLAFSVISQCPNFFSGAIISSPMVDKSDKIAKQKAIIVGLAYRLIRSKLVGKLYVRFIGIDDKKRADFFISYWTKISMNTWKNYYMDRLTFEKYPQFKDISFPVLCICGSKEPNVIKSTVLYMKKLNKNCNIQYIENAGHEHPIKKSNEFKKIILKEFNS
ncbi:alpha/beta hydrolase [Clostridium sp. YIM B02515]|uniref:Alpha/beta hydrolase n=1 Tax=Clostridium rhizosphaerae TaxID=2803861 RepID=A0ABS1T609_9CLOT|nr:alpha/beta hydrolase [Clostridium rhizosphaerae]MBL4934770.1 alpha/beta hydrolase [Clostridium rhizosphaerae]